MFSPYQFPQASDGPHSSFTQLIEIILIVLASLSSLISLLIPTLYHIKRQCRQHPTNLISKISLLEALSNYNVILIAVNIYRFEDIVNITNIFDILTFNQPEEPSETQFCEINYTLYMLLELSSIAYNICFSVDLLVTLKMPFYAGKKRMKFYNLFALIFLAATMPQAIVEASDICMNQYHDKSIYKVPLIFIIVLGLFYCISFCIIVYSYFKIGKLGSIRIKYVQHHRLILMVLLASWVFPFWNNIIINGGDESSNLFYVVNFISFISLLLLGALVNIVRFYHDPYLWTRVNIVLSKKTQIKKMVTLESFRIPAVDQRKQKLYQESESKNEEDCWNLPLASAVTQLNHQRIVHNLIQVVVQACTETEKSKLISSASQRKSKRSQSIVTLTNHQKNILDQMNKEESIVNRDDLEERFIERSVETATIEELTKITKRNRNFNMTCKTCDEETPQHRQNTSSLRQKTIFKRQQPNTDMKRQISTFQDLRLTKHPISDGVTHRSMIDGKQIEEKNYKSQPFALDVIKEQGEQQEQTPEGSSTLEIKVTSFAHKVFASIRRLNGLSEEQLEKSLDLESNVANILKAKESLGASGSFFFFSYDHKLIIKTIPQGEDEALLRILPGYFRHLKKNKKTLFSKIYGLFSVELAGVSKITFILMENSFYKMTHKALQFRQYDLKGSTVKREVKDPNAPVLKDMNYLKSNEAFVMVSKQTRNSLIEQIDKDITLLLDHNIMDYSLLLGVGVEKEQKSPTESKPSLGIYESLKQSKQIERERYKRQTTQAQLNFKEEVLRRRSTFDVKNLNPSPKQQRIELFSEGKQDWSYIDELSEISGRVYSISIIDYLQEFNFSKYMELQLKKMFKGGGDISSIDSHSYYKRFMNFVKKIIVPVNICNPEQKKPLSKT